MPLIGEVEAANLTTAQLDEQLTQKLGEKYLEHPDVSVGDQVVDRARRSRSTARSSKAGSFPVGGPTSLIQAVALAEGTTEDANARRVAVFRTIGGQRQAAAFDLTADPPRPGAGPGNLSRRHRRGRRIVDQGGAEADLPEHSAAGDLRAVLDARRAQERHVNNNIAVRNEGPWPIGPYPRRRRRRWAGPAHLFGGQHPRFSRRWCGSSTTGAGWSSAPSRSASPAAVLVDLADHAGLSRVRSRSRPTRRPSSISDEQSREQDSRPIETPMISSRPRSGLLASKSGRRAHRAGAQPRQQPRFRRRRTAMRRSGSRSRPAMVQGGLKVIPPEEGNLIKFSYDSTSPQLAALVANGVADSFINTRFSGATKPRPTPAISSSGRSTRPAAISSGPSARWSPMPSSKGSSPPARPEPTASTAAATPIRFRANRWSSSTRRWRRRRRAGSRPRAPIARRLRPGRPATSTTSRPAASPAARDAAGRISAEARRS